MNDIITIAGCMLAFMLISAGLVRYGIGLGQKLTIAAQNDLPMGKRLPDVFQQHTGDEE